MLKLVTKKTKHVVEYKGAKFDIIPNTKERHRELIEKNTYMRKVKKGPNKKPEYVEAIDFVGLMVDRIDTQVVGWTGLEGNPPCDSENKRALANMAENDHICTYILEAIDEINQAEEEEEAVKVKN